MESKQLRFALAAGAAALVALGGPAAAAAKCGKNHSYKGNPAVKQYRESEPTACGAKPTEKTTTTAQLPSSVKKELGNGQAGNDLKNVAKPQQKPSRVPAIKGDKGNPVSASIGTVTNGSNGRLIALLALMGASAVAVGGAALYRRRQSR